MLDVKITNGTFIDGTGRPARRTDVGVAGDVIEAIGDLSEAAAAKMIDATGCLVVPGFIDIHSHSDGQILEWPGSDSKLRQGVTTEVTGNCGHSSAPYDPERDAGSVDRRPWRDVASFFAYIESSGTGTNIAMLAGHGNLRLFEIGTSAAKATPENLRRMQAHLKQCLDDGCAGLSSGLIYFPGLFADRDELAALARCLPAGRMYTTHMRNESSLLFKALEEALATAEEAGSRLEISHLKACGKDVWGRAGEVLDLIERSAKNGLDVSFDAYPYNATHTGLGQLFPPWTHEGGREALVARLQDGSLRKRIAEEVHSGDTSWENILIAAGPENIVIGNSKSGKYDGTRLSDIAAGMGLEPFDAACEVIIAEQGEASIITFEMKEDDVDLILSHRLCCICSDGSGLGSGVRGHPHPRNFGAFARFLSEYLIKRQIVPLEEGVRRMTSFPAERANISRRGVLARGYHADVIVVDPEKMRVPASFPDPKRHAEGFKLVLVNGRAAVENDALTGTRAGKVIRY